MKWKRFNCGILTDLDEDRCPKHRVENPEISREVELSEEEFLAEYKKGNIYTKHFAQLEKFLTKLYPKQKEAH